MGKKLDRAYLMHLAENFENDEIARLMDCNPNTVSLALTEIKDKWEAKCRPRELKLGDDYIEYKRRSG